MDVSPTVSAISTEEAPRNTTEIVIIEDDDIQPMTIIVWCIGGILLISLLSLLGRIILAKKKYPFEQYSYFEHVPVAENRTLFQIHVDGRGQNSSISQSRDTVSLVPAYDNAVADTPVLSRTTTAGEPAPPSLNALDNLSFSVENHQQNEHRQINTQQLQCGEYQGYSTPRTAVILRPDHYGSRATINGFIIRPPPYRELVSAPNRIPSVIVARAQSHVNNSRRPMFSL